MTRSWRTSLVLATVAALFGVAGAPAAKAQQKKPNILILWGDDIGYWNLSAYNQRMMGYKTPNIDRIEARRAANPLDRGALSRRLGGGRHEDNEWQIFGEQAPVPSRFSWRRAWTLCH